MTLCYNINKDKGCDLPQEGDLKMKVLFNELPKEVQEEVRGILKAYDNVNVWYENGEYSFVDAIKKEYASDHKFIGNYKKSDVFSEKEQIENYINVFHAFPQNYKGARDYAIIKRMDNERTSELVETENPNIKKLACTDWYGEINENGDFVLTERRTVLI